MAPLHRQGLFCQPRSMMWNIGRYVLEEAGTYGGPGTFDQRLKVVAEEGDLSGGNTQITFWIDGQKTGKETAFKPGQHETGSLGWRRCRQ